MVTIIMHVEGSVIPDAPIDEFEDAWEEFEGFAEQMLNIQTRAYIGFQILGEEGEFEKFMNFVPLTEDTWGVTVGDSERQMKVDDLKKLLQELFSGNVPEWVRKSPDIDKTITGLARW